MTGHVVDVLDAVVHEEHLAAAVQLAQDRVANSGVVEMRDERANRLAVRRRRLDHREIADAEHRHVQRARNRRRRHRQHRHQFLELLDFLLVDHAEAMLLVDHQQAQPRKLHVTRKQAMGPDDDIDFAARGLRNHLAIFLVAAEPRDHLDPHRVILEAVAKRVPMLLGENRRRHQHRDLPAVHHGDKRRSQCDFGLAEAGVAANEAIHRLDAGQIANDVVDRRLLVGSLLELEARREFLVVRARRRIRVPLHHLARRINVEQLRRHRQHRLPRAPLNLLPRTAAELVELGLGVVAADVPLDEIYPLDRHVHRVVARVFEIEKIALDVGDLHVPQAAILRDTVIDMHDEIVGLQLFEIEQRALGRRPLAPAYALLAKNFFFAVEVEAVLRQHDARGDFAFHDRQAGSRAIPAAPTNSCSRR